MIIRLLIGTSIILTSACGSAPEFPEELASAPAYAEKPVARYFDLIFPEQRQQALNLQLLMVNRKGQGARVERILLQHHVDYQWLQVATETGTRWLLVSGPYQNAQQLQIKRRYLQRLLLLDQQMPALAWSGAEPLAGQTIAQHKEDAEQDEAIQ